MSNKPTVWSFDLTTLNPADFASVVVHGCTEDAAGNVTNVEGPAATFWSAYALRHDGTRECVGDFETASSARKFAALVEAWLSGAQRVALSSLKRGEYVRLSPSESAPVWVRGDFDRSAKAYELRRFDDINHTTLRKGTALVFAGFTF